jgi:putative spermidine/putrescine transport system substrate-binding protein
MMNFRRAICVAAALIFTQQAFADAAQAQQRFDGVTLRVATYGGPWGDGIKALIGTEFENLGGKLEIQTGAPSGHLAKLIVTRGKEPPFDLCEIDEPAAPQFVRAGVLQKYDVSKLPNAVGLISPVSQGGYLVPDWVFQDGVVYNADEFKKLGIPAPTRYSDLLDPRLKGRVGVPDIAGGLGMFVVYGFAIDAGGNETNIKAGLENMTKMGATQFYSGNPAAQTALIAGDVWANFMGSSWAIRLRRAGHDWAKFALLQVGHDVGIWERGHMGFAKGSRNVEAAHWFVNRLISPEIQLELSKRAGNVPVNKQAIAELDKDPLAHEILRLSPTEIEHMRRVDFDKIDAAAWHDEWNSMMRR